MLAASSRKVSPPWTSTGAVAHDGRFLSGQCPKKAAVPSWPNSLVPQHHAAPSSSNPHAWSPPAASEPKPGPNTLVGAAVPPGGIIPMPSSPSVLTPQQYAPPSAPTAQVNP